MKRPRSIMVLILLTGSSLAALWFLRKGPPEPPRLQHTYLGKHADYWIKQLDHKDKDIRELALRALKNIGPEAKDAIPHLLAGLEKRVWVGDWEGGEIPFYPVAPLVSALHRIDPEAEAFVRAARAGMSKETFVVWIEILQISRSGIRDRAVKALSELLESDNQQEVSHTMLVLKELGPQAGAAVPKLVQALQRRSPRVNRAELAHLASKIGPAAATAIPELDQILTDTNEVIRKAAANALQRFGAKAKPAVPNLLRMAADKNDSVRVDAIDALGSIGPEAKEAVVFLTDALSDPDVKVSVRVAYALGNIGPAAAPAVPILLKNIQGSDHDVSAAAVWALRRIDLKNPKFFSHLLQCLKKPTHPSYTRLSFQVIKSLGDMGPNARQAVPTLLEIFVKRQSYETFFAREVALAFGKIGAPARKAIPALLKALKEDNYGEVRYAAADALGEIGLELDTVIPALVKGLEDPDREESWATRMYTARALAKLGAKAEAALPALMKALQESNAGDRAFVAAAIWEIKKQERLVLPILIEAGLKWRYGVQTTNKALEVLASMGPATQREAISYYLKALKNEEPETRSAALRALEKLDPALAAKESERLLGFDPREEEEMHVNDPQSYIEAFETRAKIRDKGK